MPNLLLQLQLLLAALSALLPLIPADFRAKAASFLDLAGRALSVSASVAADVSDLADRLADVRAEIEAVAAAGRHVAAVATAGTGFGLGTAGWRATSLRGAGAAGLAGVGVTPFAGSGVGATRAVVDRNGAAQAQAERLVVVDGASRRPKHGNGEGEGE